MISITLPPDIETPIADEARRLGTTAELLAIESLRRLFMSVITDKKSEKETLFEYLSDYIGTVDGTSDALSENCGKRFAEGMKRKQQRMTIQVRWLLSLIGMTRIISYALWQLSDYLPVS